MKLMKRHAFAFLTICLGLGSGPALAEYSQQLPPLDPLYRELIHPIDDTLADKAAASASDFAKHVQYQTPIKSQGSRGTCSIFSGTALAESMLKKKFMAFGQTIDFDFSEQYLEYLAVRGRATDGSASPINFTQMITYGLPFEKTFPYDTRDWSKEPWLGEEHCGHLAQTDEGAQATRYQSCLVVQRDPNLLFQSIMALTYNSPSNDYYDPEFNKARNEALVNKVSYFTARHMIFNVGQVSQIKQLLKSGTPLTMGIELFYGAWNHRGGLQQGIPTHADDWARGIVGYPEQGSVDFVASRQKPAGHSIVIVGYDDEREVSVTQLMENGELKTFTYRGVYYFKNSWGTESFGRDFEVEGVNYPGYGMITQQYAHEYGSFYQLPLL